MIEALRYYEQLENTFILFQLDHGQEGKGSLFEPGIRIPQFIHYPHAFGTDGKFFNGLVSAIDIAPTILDYAGVVSVVDIYEMDGMSWKTAVSTNHSDVIDEWHDRCLAFEMGGDRAIRCGCTKYLSPGGRSSATIDGADQMGLTLSATGDNLYDLCSPPAGVNPSVLEQDGEAYSNSQEMIDMINHLECHEGKTDPNESPDYDTNCWTVV